MLVIEVSPLDNPYQANRFTKGVGSVVFDSLFIVTPIVCVFCVWSLFSSSIYVYK